MDPVLPVVTEMIDAVNNGAIGEPTGIHPSRILIHRRGVIPEIHNTPALGRGSSDHSPTPRPQEIVRTLVSPKLRD